MTEINSWVVLSRQQAQATVDAVTARVGNFAAVPVDDCRRLLGEERCELLLSDPIRCLGPVPGTVYPWNVVDYLSAADPRSLSRRCVAAKPQGA